MKYLINNINTDWKEFIQTEFKKGYMLKIDEFLFESKELILPKKQDIFRCFNFFNISETKIVIFGQDPYHNENEADGLSFSVKNDVKTPPSLKNIFKKLKNELGINRTSSDLKDWAEQGILLLNTSLTVFKNKPSSHTKIGWFHFIKNVIDKLNKNDNKILFLLLGNHAKSLSNLIDKKHVCLLSPHPSPLSVYRTNFFEISMFKTINDFVYETYKTKIKW